MIIGTPNLLFDHSISSNLFFKGFANKLDISTCASFKILTAKYSEFLNNSNPSLKSPIQIKIKGGSKETDVNELAVNPLGVPSFSHVVIIVTPVTNFPNVFLYSKLSNFINIYPKLNYLKFLKEILTRFY